MIILKKCARCKKEMPLLEFHKDRSQKSGVYSSCKKCKQEYSAKYRSGIRSNRIFYKNRQDGDRRASLKNNYGITLEQYAKMLLKQNGVCAICRLPETTASVGGGLRALSVDHDNETNKVRGLLCGRCNTGIGLLSHKIDLLKKAISYLEEHK